MEFGYEDAIAQDANVWTTFGVHPHFVDELDTETFVALEELLRRPKVVALGEIGLDYSRKNKVNVEIQKRAFYVQLR